MSVWVWRRGVGGGVKFAEADYMARAFAIEFLADCAFWWGKDPPPHEGSHGFTNFLPNPVKGCAKVEQHHSCVRNI